MVDVPNQGDIDSSSIPHQNENISTEQLILKQYQGKDFSLLYYHKNN